MVVRNANLPPPRMHLPTPDAKRDCDLRAFRIVDWTDNLPSERGCRAPPAHIRAGPRVGRLWFLRYRKSWDTEKVCLFRSTKTRKMPTAVPVLLYRNHQYPREGVHRNNATVALQFRTERTRRGSALFNQIHNELHVRYRYHLCGPH